MKLQVIKAIKEFVRPEVNQTDNKLQENARKTTTYLAEIDPEELVDIDEYETPL